MNMRFGYLWSTVVLALLAAVSVAGCRADVGPEEHVASSKLAVTAAPTSPLPTTFDLVFPQGYGISRVAIAASADVTLGPRDVILAADGSPGTVTNSGSGSVTVGPNSSTGTIASVGSVAIQPSVTATSVKSAGTVSLQKGDSVSTVTQQATLTPLAHRSVTVPPLSGTATDFVVSSGSSNLAPGLYNNFHVQQNAIVTLSAGNYVISDFNLGPQAQIKLDTSQGTINVFVTGAAVWNGQVTGDGTRFVFSYLGTSAMSFSGPFTGTALAPNAQITLGPQPTSFKGNFYGQHVVVDPAITVQEIATPLLAASVSLSNTTLCSGQQTEVKVDASDAGPGATTRINSIPGSHQFVSFAGLPGPRLIVASVETADGRADVTTVPVTVQQCTPSAGTPPPIALHFWPTPDEPNGVEFMVHGFDSNGVEVAPTGPATYAWNFGDGQVATTTSPLIDHDYTSAVNPLSAYSYFTASVTVTTSSGSTTAQKVVPIWSIYAASRAQGIVQPPSKVTPSGDNLLMTVTNYETTPLSITSARVDLLPCDPSLDPIPQATVPLSVSVPPSSTSTVTVPQPPPFSTAICAIGAHLIGNAPAGTVYTDTYARVKENPLTKQAVTDPNTIAILNQASASTADPNHFDINELRQLVAQGVIAQLPAPSAAGATYASPGEECTPGDTAPGLSCQPTANWVTLPSELLNAFKGDLVIHHACGDMVAALLATQSQQYSHSMTVTKNRVEVRHSTAVESRMTNSLDLINADLDPQKVQFGFPGTAGTQQPYTIDQMVHGYCVPDPDGKDGDSACPGKAWQVTGSLHPDPWQCSEDDPVVYPLVIRPPPDATAAQLQAVTPVGDQALAITGHYRFFMYSRADEYAVATSGPSWAVGTEESVCSLFDLESTRQAGPGGTPLPLNGGGVLNPSCAPIFSPGAATDGMNQYCADDRARAANELYGQVYNVVEGQLPPGWPIAVADFFGGLGVLGVQAAVNGLANNIANQLVNCFANDGCGDISPTWRNLTGGIAVSPDDIRRWPAPPTGTYGYSEPLVYAPTVYRRQYAWVPKTGSGSMTVIVVDGSNNPVANATVILNSIPYGSTDSSGTLQVPALDQGSYDVEAQEYIGSPPSQCTPATPSPMTPTAILALQPCSAAPQMGFQTPCSVTGSNPTCPSGGPQCDWAAECVDGTATDAPGSTCACFAPAGLLASCNLAIAQRPATVPAGGNTTVELTLCNNCVNGQVQNCTQYCASTDDCFNNQECIVGQCKAPPRIVNIQTGPDATFKVEVDNLLVGYQNATGPLSFAMTCDPHSTASAGETVCDTTTATAGPITESTSDQATFSVACSEDDQSGGIKITLSYSLFENCGGSATIVQPSTTVAQNCESAPPTGSMTFNIDAPSPSNPNPSTSVSFDSCYASDPEAFFQCPCDANEVHATLSFTSQPAQ